MILKLIIKNNKRINKKEITIWIQQHEDLQDDILQLFEFFKDDIKITEKKRLHKYFKITSDKPAIMMSLFSTAQEMIPEIYFSDDDYVEIEESPNMGVED